MKLGTGNIVGLPGQTLDHLVDDIEFACELGPDFVSSAPFIPNENTPFQDGGFGDVNLTVNTMAIWRIMLGDPLIPTVSALEKIQRGGQLMGLNAGANVITINFTPETWRKKYGIYSKERFVVSANHAFDLIERAGLRVRGRTLAKVPGPSGRRTGRAAVREPEARDSRLPQLHILTELRRRLAEHSVESNKGVFSVTMPPCPRSPRPGGDPAPRLACRRAARPRCPAGQP